MKNVMKLECMRRAGYSITYAYIVGVQIHTSHIIWQITNVEKSRIDAN